MSGCAWLSDMMDAATFAISGRAPASERAVACDGFTSAWNAHETGFLPETSFHMGAAMSEQTFETALDDLILCGCLGEHICTKMPVIREHHRALAAAQSALDKHHYGSAAGIVCKTCGRRQTEGGHSEEPSRD
jgi:hypothetical protein